jgi:hypothetical protein
LTAVSTTYTTDVETSTRSGTQLVVGTDTQKTSVGNFVTDMSMQPYMAAEEISFYAYNMRPGARVHAFFDSVNVDAYCAPGVTTAANTTSIDTSTNAGIVKTADWGTAIYADSAGHVFGRFNLPGGRFKTGDRVFTLADTTNLILGTDALTTKASATFTASNMSVTKQTVTLTTINPLISVIPVSQTVVNTTYSNTTITLPDIVYIDAQWEPIAQTLNINTPQGEAGVYAVSLDLFFKQKAQMPGVDHGVTVYLTEMKNGYPDGKAILPFSTVHLKSADINISEDASAKTTFVFESPVFLNNNMEYAFVVKPDANDPDIWVYSAALGDVDIKSGVQVYSQPVTGTAFFGATMTTWSALQTEYIKHNLNIAVFSNAQGDVYFNNANSDFVTLRNISFNNSNNTILPGDTLYQAGNSTPSTVSTTISGTVRQYDSTRNIIYVSDTTANFTNNAFIQVHRYANSTLKTSPGPNTTTIIASGNTGVLNNIVVDGLVGQFATLLPAGTGIAFDYKGASNTYLADSNTNVITPGIETDMFDKERIVASLSNETAASSGKTLTIHGRFQSDSALLSPAIDLVKANALSIANQVDPVASIYNEYYNNGTSKTKYISQVVTLASGQDAQDLQIHLTAHKPVGTDIKLYVKFLNSQDVDPIVNKTWTPMVNLGYNIYNTTDPDDMTELVYQTFPYYGLTPTTGTITSTLGSNTITGSGTKFQTELAIGQWINMPANTTYSETARQIVAIASNTSLTVANTFGVAYTANAYYIVPPPTTAWKSSTFSTQQTGTVSANGSTNIVTGSGTNFLSLLPGQTISFAQDSDIITGITNSTSLTVRTPWNATVSAQTFYLVATGGVSYLNSKNSLFTNFNRFQIKMILQSNDSSKIPIVSDIRALAMQL